MAIDKKNLLNPVKNRERNHICQLVKNLLNLMKKQEKTRSIKNLLNLIRK